MIPPRNSFYRRALASAHEAYSRVEVWRSDVQVDELVFRNRDDQPYNRDMPVFFGGSIRATLGSRTTRSATVVVPKYLYPRRTDGLLNPYSNELRIFRGIRYGNGASDEFPVFTGPIRRVRPSGRGTATVQAYDRAYLTARAGFEAPLSSSVGSLVTDEFERLVIGANPRATFGQHDALTERVPALAYDSDRGTALDDLAETANSFWYALADGRHVIRRVPWTVKPTVGSIVLKDGPGGTLLDAYPDRDASDLFNQFTVLSELPDGGPALYATASDTDPLSPTYVNGPFGVSSKQVRVTGASNQGQLLALARQLVQRGRALVESWSITCVPDGSIELGDPLDVTFDSDQALQIAAAFTMPLNPNDSMTIDGRGLSLLGEVS